MLVRAQLFRLRGLYRSSSARRLGLILPSQSETVIVMLSVSLWPYLESTTFQGIAMRMFIMNSVTRKRGSKLISIQAVGFIWYGRNLHAKLILTLYFDYRVGMNAKRRQQVVDHAPSIGVIPGLNPVEDQEDLLTEKYVAEAAKLSAYEPTFSKFVVLSKKPRRGRIQSYP